MASAFGHAALALGLGGGFINRKEKWTIWGLGIFSSIMPDFDVIGFNFGINYGSIWGHRGFTHGLLFALIWTLFIYILFFRKYRKGDSRKAIYFSIYIFLCTISHSLLDACTTGGMGVGFFTPFIENRYFFPWRVIKVSPMSIERFFSEWGLKVLQSEWKYVMFPSLILGVSLATFTVIRRKLLTK